MRIIKLGIVALWAVLAPAAAVAEVCVPPATGVFGNPTPPHWWDNVPPQSSYYQKIDDPRWVGAGTITYGNGTSTQADFRALHDAGSTELFLSWRILLAPASTANQNTLYVGLERASGPMIISVKLPSLVPAAAVGGSLTANPLNANGSLGSAVDPVPTWFSDTARVWINSPKANSFAVQLHVPLSEIVVTSGTFKMWYQVLIGTPSAPVYPFAWPRTSYLGPATVAGQVATFPHPSGVNAWDTFRLSSGPSDASCSGSGVSLDIYQIGTTNSPSSRVLYRRIPPGVPPAPVNTFFARATNDSGGTIDAGDLRARFRLANWGSLPGQESGVDPNLLWSTIPGGEDVGNAGDILDGTTATSANDNRFPWTLSNAEIAPFEDGTRSSDNCLLVELSSTTGLTFTNNSIRRNMSFVPASTFKQRAEISTKALTPIAPDGRDVYLYVEALNMSGKAQPTPKRGPSAVTHDGPTEPMTPAQYEAAAANGQLTDEQMDGSIPTYRVHVFHDSGTVIDGRPVIIPQGGFGYRVIHQGDLLGWAHRTVGEDVTLTEIAPNFYKIAKVPNNGVVHVVTTIEAREPGWRLFLDLGLDVPGGTGLDGSLSVNAGLERMVTAALSVEAIVGYHKFGGGAADTEVWQISANAKRFFGSSLLRPFVNAGGGMYRFEPAGDTKAGANVGGGLLYEASPKLALEAVYNYHKTDPLDWHTVQAGIRIGF